VLEENDTLAAEATGEENADSSGLQRCTRFGRAEGLANL
jgi:hypothetical protein